MFIKKNIGSITGFAAGAALMLTFLLSITGCHELAERPRVIYGGPVYVPPPRIHCERRWDRWQRRWVEYCYRY